MIIVFLPFCCHLSITSDVLLSQSYWDITVVIVMATKKWFKRSSIYISLKQFTPVQQYDYSRFTYKQLSVVFHEFGYTDFSAAIWLVCAEANHSLFFSELDVYWMFIVCVHCSALELKLENTMLLNLQWIWSREGKKKNIFGFLSYNNDQIKHQGNSAVQSI